MKKKSRSSPDPESADTLSFLLDDFDYRIECDDFLLYELGRLIEDDRASFEDEEFRRVIDEGIQEHLDTRLELRAEVALRLRANLPQLDEGLRSAAMRVLRPVEDIEYPLRDVGVIVRTYTTYMFRKLEECAGRSSEREDEALSWIERWQRGEVLREEMSKQLRTIGRPAVAPLADLLFDSVEDRTAAETAIDILGSIRSTVSARVLAHAVSEPMLDEDLESKACELLRTLWPLPRHYVLYGLRPHTHEDLPFRWYQLLVDCDDPAAVDRILEEVLVHSGQPDFREDLVALLELLRICRDPETESRILELINTAETPPPAARLLEGFVKTYRAPAAAGERSDRDRFSNLRSVNKKYLSAAKLFDARNKPEALRKLNELLREEPRYPFALMLKRLI